jgi:hypothetical protein
LYHKIAQRILIVDPDVHQGNGTAKIFEKTPEVFTFSIHGANNFPARKEKSDLDIPMPDNTGDEKYLKVRAERSTSRNKRSHRTDFIFYISWVDVLETDKLGKWSLSKEGCKERDRLVFEVCKLHHIPVSVCMGEDIPPRFQILWMSTAMPLKWHRRYSFNTILYGFLCPGKVQYGWDKVFRNTPQVEEPSLAPLVHNTQGVPYTPEALHTQVEEP